jgi:hypothetical protein
MSGAFSSIVNFTIEQFLKRAGKLSVLTEIENQSETGQLKCSLKFPKHHKRRLKQTILKKQTAGTSISLFTIDNIRKTVYRAFDDAYNLLFTVDVNSTLEKRKIEEEHTSDDEENVSSVSASGKTHFHGMRVYDNIPSQSKSYFCVEIDGKKNFLHKQTACWLLTDEKASLSADRVKRVQQEN